jgi:hypothetical protein
VKFLEGRPTLVDGAGMKQPLWQFAACELHDIMQFVTVEVTGVDSPVKGRRLAELYVWIVGGPGAAESAPWSWAD